MAVQRDAAQGDLFSALGSSAPPAVPAAALEPPPTLTLIDASGFIFRAYHALPPFSTSKGVPTHAVLGFTRMVLKLLRERVTSHVALCFDKDSRKGRLAIDPTYKANRVETPPDLLTQFGLIRQVAEVLNLPILEVEGWEADDVIATLTKRARAAGLEVEIVTSDKDFLQLLAPGVRIYDAMKDKPITESDAREKLGIRADQMRDYQALVGDAIDNIPKVPGIGPKTAADLLNQFQSIEVLLTRLAEVPKPKIRAALEANQAQLLRALDLVSFRDELPIEVELESLRRQLPKQAESRALFVELEFQKLLSEMPAPPPTPLRTEAVVVATMPALTEVLSRLAASPTVVLVPLVEGPPQTSRPLGLALLGVEGPCTYVDVEACGAVAVGAALQPLLLAPERTLVAHDGKALLHALAAMGCTPAQVGTDVELLSYLLNPSRRLHALADMARERLRLELIDEAPDAGSPVDEKARWAAGQADAMSRLAPLLWEEIETTGLGEVVRTLERPLTLVLAKMERAGVRVDTSVLGDVSATVDGQIDQLLAEVYRHAGRELNVGSPLQLAQVLYDELHLPVLKKNKTGPSTDHEVLEKLAEQHPLPRAIIEYRNVAKLKSTYLDTLPALVGADGRVRTTFHQAATATGRLSSTDPNLQNIPIRTELGRQIRRAFVAAPGHVLLSADYSQIELRILAHITGDPALVSAFAEGADVHTRTAAEVFGVPEAEVTDDNRRAAKMVNYGIAYGLSPHGLHTRLNISMDEAKSIIDRYFARFPGISRYVEQTLEKTRRTGFVESLFGRRRAMPDILSRNRTLASAAERAAINMPIQGTAADLVKRAMLACDAKLPADCRMLLQVHDELLFECAEGVAAERMALIREIMSSVASWSVPLEVDVGAGPSWADAH
ncbi:MAG: DNA polymerase I [Archangium sp.]|nr:DNA polymerase I [Archangium sp.]